MAGIYLVGTSRAEPVWLYSPKWKGLDPPVKVAHILRLKEESETVSMNKRIRMKSIYAEKSKDDGHRILITRYYPRGVKRAHFDDWVRELAPSRELLKQYKEGEITWKKFERKFVKEMSGEESIRKLQMLSTQAKKKPITLLCYEKNDYECHRHLVQDLLLEKI